MGASSEVPALRRGLAILTAMAGRAAPVSAGALARELGLPRSTTYHLLAELVAAGFVVRLPEERRFALGVAAFELGSAYLRADPLERLASPVLRRLVDEVGCTAHLGVLHGGELLYLLQQRPSRAQTLVTDVGVRLPAHLTASGRAMLAHLPAAQVRASFPAGFASRTERGPRTLPELRRVLDAERRLGWAVEDGHVTGGFASVACPVFGPDRWPSAAISVTFRHVCEPAGRTSCGATWPELADKVRIAAEDLTGRIDGRR
ncbi:MULTISPECIES: IclR family transcriptional regulator [unclassified Saccharopolyspora]|uniref:IclR family transcriptional regulator n=1 Tax=unclassified Saccharopolyspora TaxID=2646250 RepID=UPI001CD33D92|nr:MULTISPECIES: IclR family transcriptional regulator [unclassified Saccharopolyspora]MCA1188454.1 IclR family transcriptional regulator [Saccharopolyspora sp. 6T]MCA1190778.1 IclR family transcriptional regulator [Saccharopolyspora sp. 6V]MCA1226930.1 IclR family transcriptional regulator [Saccharopolyspora sp. 6M]MCA1283349.1 IclR family transcriptional regulator [Saccharopolyspora sp. 7B]